ncbi:MAG: pyridoxal-phosphate dependent enzyme [Burkholderiales bacterium]|nr:pyridoxal-phosphate dependent enzyme [Burkholderiales bacterium]
MTPGATPAGLDAVELPALADIRAAHARILPFVHRTPVFTCRSLDDVIGAQLFWKCENLQKVGAFKARGACNAVFALPADDAARGVVTHSSGNHGAALAYAARRRGIPAHVVMPDNAPRIKVANVEGFGARIHYCKPTLAAREDACAQLQHATGATLVHPYDDFAVIAGQGTAALELLEAVPDLDAVVAPIGGGGVLSGTAIAAKAMQPDIDVLGAEPAAADDAARSFMSGTLQSMPNPQTIADGLRGALSERTLRALRMHVATIGTCSEEAIIAAMRLIWERMKVLIEPSSAVPLAAMLEGALSVRGRRVGVILTGGNVDLDRLPWQK